EFLGRADGWPGLARRYGLTRARTSGIQHELAYGAIASGRIDVTDIYTTDAQIQHLGLVVLGDDRGFFPRYDAVLLYRSHLAPRARWLAGPTLTPAGLLQTVPSLALLAFLIPLLGIGAKPALAALFLYGLLPIVRNTYTGLATLPPQLSEAARALGLSARARLFEVELPMASPMILAGIKTSAVITVGTATLAALIGA